jgi:hypothetical protein
LALNWPRYLNFHAFRTLSTYTKYQSAFYPHMLNFVPHIISLQVISFCVSANTKFFLKIKHKFWGFSLCANFIPHMIRIILRIISIWKITFLVLSAYRKIFLIKHSFCVLSIYAMFHSVYVLNFIPNIIRIRKISFCK